MDLMERGFIVEVRPEMRVDRQPSNPKITVLREEKAVLRRVFRAPCAFWVRILYKRWCFLRHLWRVLQV